MSIAFTNFLVACGSSMIQPLFGFFLDLGWDGLIQEGIPIYSLRNYHVAMLSFPIALLLAFILLLFLKERQKVDKEIFSEVVGMD